VSAKSGLQVKEAFEMLGVLIDEKRLENPDPSGLYATKKEVLRNNGDSQRSCVC
jgi:hypothetical protein